MNFTRFPANTTNIFPIANSDTGGQLLTEFNLRSRESVLTPEEVKYSIGPSYVHAQEDFSIRLQEDEIGTVISSTVLQITSGRAVVNGHYIESLVDVEVDIAEANNFLKSESMDVLKGRLGVGLRAMYSTEQTLSASMRVENNQNLMEGVQIVILPLGKIEAGYFVLPTDSPEHEELVTAHIKLGEFYYVNGTIRSISQNEYKTQYIPASRIGNFDSLLGSSFVSRRGLNPKKLYTFAGKSSDPNAAKDTWCDSTDSLFVWQKASDLHTTETPQLSQAEFGINEKEAVTLTLPHKSIDGGMYNTDGKEVFYEPRVMNLPVADFSKNTPGTITGDYTRTIKYINQRITDLYHFPAGRQRAYIPSLSEDKAELPTLNQSEWKVGDYILVGQDNSLGITSSDFVQAPSTIYVVLAPEVTEVTYSTYNTSGKIPASCSGVELYRKFDSYNSIGGGASDTASDIRDVFAAITSSGSKAAYNASLGIVVDDVTGEAHSEYHGTTYSYTPDSVYAVGEESGGATATVLLEGTQIYYQDYITYVITDVPIPGTEGKTETRYLYYIVTKTKEKKEYTPNPVVLTGSIPLATEDAIGGFFNVSDTQLDNGYVFRDEDGYLRVLDYSLLRSGVLAYQLGEDVDFGSGLSSDEIQEELDEYVNNRVAFPSEKQIENAKYPNVIQIHLNLSNEDSYNTINLQNIDSRWGCSIYLHISGEATNYTTINIINCEKVRIGSIEGTPTINLYNSCLYYDGDVIEYINTCERVHKSDNYDLAYGGVIYDDTFTGIENLSLWYERFEDDDPNLIVDGMTVTETSTPIIPEDYDFWSESVVNDAHYYFGLQSLTFSPNGTLVGCGIYMRNDMTANVEYERTIAVAQFTLPQGSTFVYPVSSLAKPIKITGSFVTAYPTSEPAGYTTMVTEFTALTQTYNKYSSDTNYNEYGTISFLNTAELINTFIGIDPVTDRLDKESAEAFPIDGWEPNSYHVFKGWTIG